MHCGQGFERLCRYVGRPPVATERLSGLPDGRLLYRLRHRWRDGTTHVVFEPLDLVARLAALVPPPRFNTVRYHGILAPCAGWRDHAVRDREEVPTTGRPPPSCPCTAGPTREGAPAKPTVPPDGGADLAARHATPPTSEKRAEPDAVSLEERCAPGRAPLRERRLPWAKLLRRVFDLDALRCDRCGGRMRILAAIEQPEVARAILECLGLSSRAPPLSAAPPSEPTDLGLGFEEPWPTDELHGVG